MLNLLKSPLRVRVGRMVLLSAVCVSMVGCASFGRFAKTRADRAAYATIERKQIEALGESRPISVDARDDELTSDILHGAARISREDVALTTPSLVVSLSDALALAFANSRSYQSQKESLFLSALSLTGTRYDFGLIFNASADGTREHSETGHNGPGDTVTERFGTRDIAAGVSKILCTGAVIGVNLSQSLTKSFSRPRDKSVTNAIGFSVVQPLLNGAGPLVAHENLRQAERDLIYDVRDFQRFQQGFTIGIASGYYDLLQSLDQVENERSNLEAAIADRERTEMFARAGRMSSLQADQALQRELVARDRWTNAQANYASASDRFKFDLGLPLDLDIGPDPLELERMAERGLPRPKMGLQEAIEMARADRLDLKTQRERVEDSERAVKIALRNFLPNLDAGYTYHSSRTIDYDRFTLHPRNRDEAFSLSLDLPLDWTPRRNNYRQSLIGHEQSKRSLAELGDLIVLEVRNAWRELERTRQNYRNQINSVRLAERRVESTSLLLEAGSANTRDLLEAQDALLDSQNAASQSLVSHTIARLEFWNSIERLKIDPKGMWYE